MSHKSKGIAAERELVHILQDNGFAAIRIAGSGSTKTPSADILAGNGVKLFAFECKTIGGDSRYITHQAVDDFVRFAHQFGAQPWIAIRFARSPWRFLHFEDVPQTAANYAITRNLVDEKGLLLSDLIQ